VQLAELFQQRVELDATVCRRVRRQTPDRLCELALHPDPSAAAGLIPRHRDVDEALQEVAFLGRSGTPRILELLVCREVLPGTNQREARVKSGR
jgi:hypothetical protein